MPFLTHLYDTSRPSYFQRKAIGKLRDRFMKKFDETQHADLLHALYTWSHARAFSASHSKYERTGSAWRYIGFMQENPSLDLNPGGELALQCLVYFVTNHSGIAKQLIKHRARRDDYDEKNYPWATVGLKIVGMIAAIFDIYDCLNGIPITSDYKYQSYWHMITENEAFERLFVSAVLLFEVSWVKRFHHHFKTAGYNFSVGITIDWGVVVWSLYDPFVDLLNHCSNIEILEKYAEKTYANLLLNDSPFGSESYRFIFNYSSDFSEDEVDVEENIDDNNTVVSTIGALSAHDYIV